MARVDDLRELVSILEGERNDGQAVSPGQVGAGMDEGALFDLFRALVNTGEACAPQVISDRSILIDGDIAEVLGKDDIPEPRKLTDPKHARRLHSR